MRVKRVTGARRAARVRDASCVSGVSGVARWRWVKCHGVGEAAGAAIYGSFLTWQLL